jgi:hypothetical protein
MAQAFAVLAPVIEDGPAIEKDHGRFRRVAAALTGGKVGALKQAEDVEWRLQLHALDHLVIGKVLHHEDELAAKLAERVGEAGKAVARQRFKFVERRRDGVGPVHGGSIATRAAPRQLSGLPRPV